MFRYISCLFVFYWALPTYGFLAAPRLSPVSQMHALPRIEEPGWSTTKKITVDVTQANHWNAPSNFRRTDTGQILRATIDFEETNYNLTFVSAMSSWFQLGSELSWIDRGGGHLDQMIDQFHVDAKIYRFQRERYSRFESRFMTETDGVEKASRLTSSGLSNVVLRGKFWLAKWGDPKYETGLSLLFRHKQSIDDGLEGRSSGSQDQTFSLLTGTPITDSTVFYFSATYAQIGGNFYFRDWPRNSSIQMYEASFVIGLSEKFQLIISHGTESPFMDKGKLEFVPDDTREDRAFYDRSSSAFNHLTGWRGQQTAGVRFLFDPQSSLSFYFVEDWEYSDRDNTGDVISTSGAPDVAFGLQYSRGIGSL